MSTSAGWADWMPLGVDAHVYPGTQIGWKVYPAQRRVTFDLRGTNSTDLTLYLERADLVRFHEAVGSALTDLDQAMATDPA